MPRISLCRLQASKRLFGNLSSAQLNGTTLFTRQSQPLPWPVPLYSPGPIDTPGANPLSRSSNAIWQPSPGDASCPVPHRHSSGQDGCLLWANQSEELTSGSLFADCLLGVTSVGGLPSGPLGVATGRTGHGLRQHQGDKFSSNGTCATPPPVEWETSYSLNSSWGSTPVGTAPTLNHPNQHLRARHARRNLAAAASIVALPQHPTTHNAQLWSDSSPGKKPVERTHFTTSLHHLHQLHAGRSSSEAVSMRELRCTHFAPTGMRFHLNTHQVDYSPLPRRTFHSTHLASADFPGARTEFTAELQFVPEQAPKPIPCFQVLDLAGQVAPGAEQFEVDQDLALDMYRKMVVLQVMDSVFYEAQRQGRFSFYMTTAGEEAINIASAAALSSLDHVFAQYREPGVLLWRGYTLKQFSDQCFGNAGDSTKGRQMPIHYGSAALRFHTISSPLTTQVPHAVGAAYGLKMSGEDCCSVTFFGEGAASEGDFHAALNFAAVLQAPVLFICRNNGWAISTPSTEQYKGDGIAGRGQAYGVRSIRVDGNDVLAVFAAVREARRQVVHESIPILLEALTYRTGHHSTSDDSSRYRGAAELSLWKTERDPTRRFQKWLRGKGWWSQEDEDTLRETSRREVIDALEAAEKLQKPPLSDLFSDVYDSLPPNLLEQREKIMAAVRTNPSAYPQDVPLS